MTRLSDEWLQDREVIVNLVNDVKVYGSVQLIIYDADGRWRNVWLQSESGTFIMVLADQIAWLEA